MSVNYFHLFLYDFPSVEKHKSRNIDVKIPSRAREVDGVLDTGQLLHQLSYTRLLIFCLGKSGQIMFHISEPEPRIELYTF